MVMIVHTCGVWYVVWIILRWASRSFDIEPFMCYCWSKNSCLTNVSLYNPNTMAGMAGDVVFSPLDVVQNLLSFLSRWLRHVAVEVYVVGVTVPYIAEPDGRSLHSPR